MPAHGKIMKEKLDIKKRKIRIRVMRKYRFNALALIEDIYNQKKNITEIMKGVGISFYELMRCRRGLCPTYSVLRKIAKFFGQPLSRYIIK